MIPALLLRWGVSERLRGPLAILIALALIAALCGLLWLGFTRYVAGERKEAVQIDRSDAVAEATNRVLAADREASANQMARDAITANQQGELRDEAAKGDASAVGPGTRGVLDKLREQQAAGRR